MKILYNQDQRFYLKTNTIYGAGLRLELSCKKFLRELERDPIGMMFQRLINYLVRITK